MKIFVIGGGGFFGQVLCCGLVECGYQVFVFNCSYYLVLQVLGVGQICGDFVDFDVVWYVVVGVDVVFYNGVKVGVWGSYDSYFQVNVVGIDNVIVVCCVYSVGCLVYIFMFSVIYCVMYLVEGFGVDEVLYGEDFQVLYVVIKIIVEQCVFVVNDVFLVIVVL